MTTRPWTEAELDRLAGEPLIRVITERPDGSERRPVVIGHVRIADEVIVRSLTGTSGAWYRAAIGTGHGWIEVAGQRVRVAFTPDRVRAGEVDAAFRARYGDDAGVRRMTSGPAREAALVVRAVDDGA